MAECYRKQGNNKDTETYFLKEISLREKMCKKYNGDLVKSYRNISNYYKDIREKEKSQEYSSKAEKLLRTMNK